MRYRFLYKFDAWSSSSVESSLQDEYARAKINAIASSRDFEEGIYTPKCVTLVCPGPVHEEEGWDIEIVHRFQTVEQSDC